MVSKPKDPEVRVSKKFKKPVKVPISDEEITKKDHQIRKNLTKIAGLEEDMKPFKDKKKALVSENSQLRLDCENREEDRETFVVNEFHFKKNLVLVKTADTGIEVERRAMTEEERQEEFGDLLGGRDEHDDGELPSGN